jgi:tRNA(Arg) A34 adenosine deaminase TadA
LAARTAGAPDGLTRDLLGRQAAPLIRAGWDAGLIEEGEAAAYARRFQLGVDRAEASLLLARDSAAALSRLADPRDFPALDAPARAILTARAGARAAALPADERAAQTRAGLDADIAAEQARVRTAARLFSGIDGGTAGLADIEDAAATGGITPSDRGALIAALQARRAREERDAEHVARVGAALRGDAPPLDPSHQADRAAADAYYARVLAPALMNRPSDTGGADRQIADFAARTGIVPSAVVARARAEMTFGTPAEQARAARLVAALPENLRDQAGADLAARAAVLAPLLDSGLPPELALRVADSGIQQRAQGAQQRLDRTKDGAVPPLGNRSDIAGTEGGADNGNINFYGHVGNDSARPTEPKKATRPNGWFQNYLVESMEALERMPGDIVGMARDLVTEPGEFLKQSAPAVVGLGLAMPIARASAAATESEDLSALTSRAKEIHNLLDHVARKQRVTAVLSTDGDTIVASGGRDLAPLQINSLRPGEVLAKLPGTHAEITALSKAQEAGVVPRVLVTTRPICPACATAIKSMGGQLIDETTAIFPR